MRLIDADALKINIYHNRKEVLNDELVQCIDNTPTAYDMENVVKQLEVRKNKNTSLMFEADCFRSGIDVAIEIVKGGGVDA